MVDNWLIPWELAVRLSRSQKQRAHAMARITVEDCLDHVENLFDLVILASKRARRLANGAQALVEWENDKPTVVALREIAAGLVNSEMVDEIDLSQEDLLSSEESERLLAEGPLGQMRGGPINRGKMGSDPIF